MMDEKSYKSSSAWMISMMLFEKSHKFIRLPAYLRRNLQRRRNAARRAPAITSELLPDPIYAKIGTQSGITDPVCKLVNGRKKIGRHKTDRSLTSRSEYRKPQILHTLQIRE